MNKQNKQLTELSDEELKQVNGGYPGNIHATVCDELTDPCDAGMRKSPINCQCVPMPNADLGVR